MRLLNYRLALLSLPIILLTGCNNPAAVTPVQPAASVVEPAKTSHPTGRPSSLDLRDSYSKDRNDSRPVSPKGRSKLRSAAIIGGTAGVGAAIGALAGGGKAAAIGAIAGGGAGLVYDRATAHKAQK